MKVLDFGLAKAMASADAADARPRRLADGHRRWRRRAGIILGTAAYMSPEQAKGRHVDRRTDLWAFGAVLYELLTGRRAFQGESVAEILSHVLTQAPDWALLPADTPASIRTLLRRCLEKNPAKRLDSAVTLRLEIDDALAAPAGVTTAAGPQARRRRITWEAVIVALVAASLITALGTWAVMRKEPPAPALTVRYMITPPPTEPITSSTGRRIALSPDGRYLAYQSLGRLMLRALDQLDAVVLSNSGDMPFFSPDSRWIGFFDGGDLKKVAVTGESVLTLCRELGVPNGGTWGDDGTIVVSTEDDNIGLRRCSADGPSKATELTKPDAAHPLHRSPSMLPGGRGVLYTTGPRTLEGRRIAVLDLKTGEQKTLRSGYGANYLDTGHLVYATAGSPTQQEFWTLWVIGFDLDRLALRGEPVRVSETMQIEVSGAVPYAVSRTGALAYVPASVQAPRSLVWVDRATGRETAIDGLPPRTYDVYPALSPDDTRVAFTTSDREGIWTWDFAQKKESRLTVSPGVPGVYDYLPRWTLDSRRIVFQSNRDGPLNLYSVTSDGSGTVERLTTSNQTQVPNSITPDGTALLFCEVRPKTGCDILRLPLAAPQGAGRPTRSDERLSEATVLLATPAAEYAVQVSPNGRYFAYQSAESFTGFTRSEGDYGRFDVYVRAYPDASKRQWSISTEGGKAPMWSRTGRELFYLDESHTLMAVPVDTSGPQFSAGRPAKVFNTTYWGSYDVTKDGRFLMIKESNAGDRSQPSIVVVLNWFEELRRRMPIR